MLELLVQRQALEAYNVEELSSLLTGAFRQAGPNPIGKPEAVPPENMVPFRKAGQNETGIAVARRNI